MSYEFSSTLWPPQLFSLQRTTEFICDGRDVCIYGPTGGGKTTVAIELLRWCEEREWSTAFYTNRKLLTDQTRTRFANANIDCGVRAANFEACSNPQAIHQICSAPTEHSRVVQRGTMAIHPADVVVIDEAHIQSGDTMQNLVRLHKQAGAKAIVGLTATPIGINHMFDELVISGRLAEYRKCNAIVPAMVKCIEQPDMRKVKRNKTGEFVIDGKKKAVYTQTIVGNVIDRWKKYNPDARPTLLYAPDVAGSQFFTEQFEKAGVKWCHVDATDVIVDGKQSRLSVTMWAEILERFKGGDIKGISSRFKLREGIDIPTAYHCILATPIGSLASYIQTIGRILRYSPETPDVVLVTDHGGNRWRFGSPNHDQPWREFWDLPEHAASSYFFNAVQNKSKPEPIRCPKCETERNSGPKCPTCGFEHTKSSREVIMENGDMKEVEGELVLPKYIRRRENTQELWTRMYWGFRKNTDQTFNQMEAFFFREHGYCPPRDLLHMPIVESDWARKVKSVPNERIRFPDTKPEPKPAKKQDPQGVLFR
jgi:superfamily II DNA or RNA helicase